MTFPDILINPGCFCEEDKVYMQGDSSVSEDFETSYIKIRDQEKGILSIDAIRKLPEVPKANLHYNEWQVRQFSSRKLINYLSQKSKSIVVEVGCGNGWLSAMLARNLDALVVGVDVQRTELRQAACAFGEQQNLYFMYANILGDVFKKQSIDTIILAASVQYFENFNELISKLLSLLKDTGEIHIIDSPFYGSQNDVSLAKERSERHFVLTGTPEMCGKYFHHSFRQLTQYNHQVLYDPKSIISRLKRKVIKLSQGVFPWICIWK